MAEEEEKANWLDLPDHLLELVIDKLNFNLFDYIRCGTVCVSWRSVFIHHAPKPFPPLLLIPTPDDNDDGMTKSRSFYSISDNKVCDFQVKMPHYRQCRGSGPGSWLITVDDLKTSYSIRFFNPFLSHEILLPPLETFPHSTVDTIFSYTYLEKAVLSADPLSNPDDYTVLAIFSGIRWLAFYKFGDKAWTQIRMLAFLKPVPDGNNAWTSIKRPSGFHDIIYKDDIIHKVNFLAIRYDGEVVAFNPEHRASSRRIALGPEKKEDEVEPQKYLVHTSNNVVMLVHRCFEDHDTENETYTSSTTGFKVYKLILVNQWKAVVNKWEPVKSLGDHALFIGTNNCISICTSDYPGALIKPNCIYYLYIDDPTQNPSDMGVYNLEDGSFEKHYHRPGISSIYPEPIWIQHQPANLTYEAIHKQQTN